MEESKQILVSLGRLEENFKNLNSKIDSFAKTADLVMQTDSSVKSAHNRIDDFKRDYDEKIKAQKEDFEKQLALETKTREECLAAETKAREDDIKQLEKSMDKDLTNQKDSFKDFISDIKFLKRSVYGGFITLIGGLVMFGLQWFINN